MSSGDDSDAGPSRRKRSPRLPEGSPSTSSSGGSPIIGPSSRPRRRPLAERNLNLDSSDSESDSGSFIRRYNKRKKNTRVTSGTDSDNSDSIISKRPKKTGRIPSESDLSDSSSIIFKRSNTTGRIPSESDVDSDVSDRGFEGSTSSQWETDCSDTESARLKPEVTATAIAPSTNIDSDSSDGQSEKCPICLASFKTQEIGTPESCDHVFCLECIQEWSKNVNTCPVDRQEYGLVLVRKSIDGKVIKQIPIEKPAPQNDVDILEDPTFCEICHSSNNEDRMLLCDGCDLGFHLDCLTPPLSDVPAGTWYCDDCSPDDDYNSEIEMYEIQLLLDDAEMMDRPQGRRRSHLPRLVPRTRHSERVRRRIANNRQQNVDTERPTTSSSPEGRPLVERVSSSTSRPRRSRKPKKSNRRVSRVRYEIVYVIDPTTGETVPVKKPKRKSRKSKKSRRHAREAARPKTVKKRLAAQLRICAPRSVPQSLPDVRADTATTNTLGGMRFQAGIPTLHLFGQNHQLDYFSDGDEDDYYESGSQVLIGRTPNRSDISAMRRAARRKAVTAPSTVSSSTDLLGSILSSQELFHSKNASYRLDSSGKFQIENEKSSKGYVDLKKQRAATKQRPNSYQNQGGGNPGYSGGGYHSHNLNQYHSTPTSTMESSENASYGGGSPQENEAPQDYTQRTLCASYDPSPQERKDEDNTGTNTPNSESEIDIYSDIETVSTSKIDDCDLRPPSPPSPPRISNTPITGTDDENNDSELDMVIDDEKVQEVDKSAEEAAVTSTVGFNSQYVSPVASSVPDMVESEMAHSSTEIQSGAVQSSGSAHKIIDYEDDSADGCPNTSIYSKQSMDVLKDNEDADSDDGCPNFSIYSKESKSVALHTDISVSAEDNPVPICQDYQVGEISSSPNVEMPCSPEISELPENAPAVTSIPSGRASFVDKFTNPAPTDLDASDVIGYGPVPKSNPFTDAEPFKSFVTGGILGGLYSDSEDEAVVNKGGTAFDLSDINHMTEDISEEERSYTPCLDERAHRQGLEGLETELISDEDRNDFDESHELKTASDGDALEINAKESELDFTRPEDYEEGEIVDKNKAAKKKEEAEKDKKKVKPKKDDDTPPKKPKKKEKEKQTTETEKEGNKENESNTKESSFKKLSKNTKERNYRDKDKESDQHASSEKSRDDKKDKKREKRKELERYNVRALIADKPRPLIIKDQFGRDVRRTPSRSRSRSYTPPIQMSPSRGRESPSRSRRSATPKPQRSVSRPRSLSRSRKSASKERTRKRRVSTRHRSASRSRSPRKKRPVSKGKKGKRSISRYGKRRKPSADRFKSKKKPRPRRSRSRTPTSPRRKRDWNRAGWTPVSMSPSPEDRHISPSWTPPRLVEASQDHMRNQNFTVVVDNSNKKKKDKRRKSDKRGNKESGEPRQKKRRRERERTPPPSKEVFASGDNILVSVSFNNENETRDVTTRDRRKKDDDSGKKKSKERKQQSKNKRDLSGVKPVAIIDLERSPFKELTPSPKDVIVLSDSDNNDTEPGGRIVQKNICDSSQQMGSPERSVNYSTGPKTPPEPQVKFSLNAKPPQVRAISNPLHEPDDMENNDEAQDEINESVQLHKGPNTPPEPPNSPPSSPDAYDPFEPTKSRSPTPEPLEPGQLNSSLTMEDNNAMDSRSAIDLLEKSTNPPRDNPTSLTPPIADIQPADSQSSIQVTPESNLGKSPERIGVLINQTVQPSMSNSKPVAQTTPFSSVSTSMITSTPVSSNLAPSRINILNSTIIAPLHVASSIPQRIVLPNQVKSSPVKISPTKAAIKSTPIKPMPNKASKSGSRKGRAQNGSGAGDDNNMDLDSPYSPGSSDYEDLFEPPPDNVIKSASKSVGKSTSKSPQKHQSVFDALFGSPNFSVNKSKGKNDKAKFGKKPASSGKTKMVGVKLDEDNLKILDDLPNSAVEMQVKDKFLKKLNRQERVVEEVKLVLKPHYNKKRINKEEYKDILRRAVPKICHNKSGEINPTKIKNLIEAYIKKVRHSKKVTSSSSVNPQKA